MASGFNRAEAERWLSAAEKVLSSRDFNGARSFAIRAREYDPSLEAPNQVLAVADTIIAGESFIITPHGNQYQDWYSILQLDRFTQSIDLIATQYRKLTLLLNPERNRFPFADRCFKLVYDAWSVLSNPNRKIMYDTQLQLSHLGDKPRETQTMPQPPPPPAVPSRRSPVPPARPSLASRTSLRSKDKECSKNRVTVEEGRSHLNNVTESARQTRLSQAESTRENRPSMTESTSETRPSQVKLTRQNETEPETGSFWTACPYCYILYEYPKVYEDCILKCQNCRRAFHAVVIASPPVTEKDTYFCCWGFFPVGYSGNGGGDNSKWTPLSPMFPCPKPGEGKSKENNKRAPVLSDEVIISDSESDPTEESDDEWGSNRKKTKLKNVKGKGNETRKIGRRPQSERGKKDNQSQNHNQYQNQNQNHNQYQNQNQNQNQNVGDNVKGVMTMSGSGGRVLRSTGRKQMRNGLDLNVEFSNELEEPVPVAASVSKVNQENGMEDNYDGVFFEGLDEFLSSLPILNVVKDDKVKPT